MKNVSIILVSIFSLAILFTLTSMTMGKTKETGAYLEVTLKVLEENRQDAGGVYLKYKQPFLTQIEGATSKELLLRTEDVQVLHGFETESDAKDYLSSELFAQDIVGELKPHLQADPEVRIYSILKN